eukprot:GHVQ01015774.1.p1 GENE.GHVQ01015774.1~~GHVQ01015774.1.p1  ORF type:complete len:228 (+),score=30.13 GHVQ01015774.1:1030-1713(+)
MRWRSEREVVQGKGQFVCGNKDCVDRGSLKSYELHFKYQEEGQIKEALVKARLCLPCACKLNYKNSFNQDEKRTSKKRRSRHKERKHNRRYSSQSHSDTGSNTDNTDRSSRRTHRRTVGKNRSKRRKRDSSEHGRDVRSVDKRRERKSEVTDSETDQDGSLHSTSSPVEPSKSLGPSVQMEEPSATESHQEKVREMERSAWEAPLVPQEAEKSDDQQLDDFLSDLFF